MYIKNISILKSQTFRCEKKLGRYILSRSIPLLGMSEGKYVFRYGDILEELLKNLPKGLRKEGYEIK